jgi:hypothetical protein
LACRALASSSRHDPTEYKRPLKIVHDLSLPVFLFAPFVVAAITWYLQGGFLLVDEWSAQAESMLDELMAQINSR